jgi:hypothetical protein
MTKRTKIALVAGTAVLALVGIGGGVAFASGGSTAATPGVTTTAATTSTTAHPHKARGLLARTEHGELTLHKQVVDVQRGQVTAVSPTSVTVRSKDGFSATYAVATTSKVRSKKQAATIGAVHDGDRVLVVAVHSGTAHTLRRLADNGPAK